MEQRQRLGQDGNMRWRTGIDRDESGYQWPPFTGPPSKKVNSGLPVRGRSVYPPYGMHSTTSSNPLPVREEVTTDETSGTEDRKPLHYLRSSMGRLRLQKNEEMTGKTSLPPLVEGTTVGESQPDREHPGLTEDNITGSDFSQETMSPLTIRNHIKAKMKTPDEDTYGIRMPDFQEVGPNHTSSINKTRRDSHHSVSKIWKEMGDDGSLPEQGYIAPYLRHRNPIPALGARTTSLTDDEDSGRVSYPCLRVRPPGRVPSKLSTAPRLGSRQEATASIDERYPAPRPSFIK
ncbi:hypothetical protein KVR01_007982 [Diaporthe batatas]|uniref:uncharacterized protein n=1 Tax=Diaporthe batatas TaxID=748121 RepID=UPI001D03E814|nr:uncharacterized protein KVR01_007982 [Diaporthe batatas]KAG8162217.1 hypothetical protein KVR01_007982 [Diaporthe batatas]